MRRLIVCELTSSSIYSYLLAIYKRLVNEVGGNENGGNKTDEPHNLGKIDKF